MPTQKMPLTSERLAAAWLRVQAKCVWIGDCFVWQGQRVGRDKKYGSMSVHQKRYYVHRLAYEVTYGPVPEGLTIDHVAARGCRFTTCCNPAHLEAVTMRENLLRGNGFAGVNARKTTCPYGHPLTEDNLDRWHLRLRGRRICRRCHTITANRRRNERREALRQQGLLRRAPRRVA